MDQVADIRTMLNDFDISAVLTDVSASTSTTVKGIFSNESEEVDVGDIQVEVTEPQPLIVSVNLCFSIYRCHLLFSVFLSHYHTIATF